MESVEKGPTFNKLVNGLRGLAVLLVLGFHFNVPFLEQGFWGVDLFFWISGFLITGGFLREYSKNREDNQKYGWIDVRYYFLRRVKRILPLSILVAFLVAIFSILSGNVEAISQNLRRIPRILTFSLNMQIQNDNQNYFLGSNQDYGLLHYWSLSVEEQIYILSPILFLLATSLHGKRVFAWKSSWISRVLILNIFLSLTSMTFMIFQNRADSISNYYSTFSRFWEFGFGSICSILNFQGISKKIDNQLSIYLSHMSSFALIAAIVTLKNNIFGPVVLVPLFSTSIFVLLNYSKRRKTFLARILETRMLQFLGFIAFPLYLVHWPAMVLLHHTRYHSSLINVLLYLLILVAVSYILHRYIELPAIRINLERFKRNSDSEQVNFLSGRSKSQRRIVVIGLFVTLSPILWLSYPAEVESRFYSLKSFFLQNRYGTLTENDSKVGQVKTLASSPSGTSLPQDHRETNMVSPNPDSISVKNLRTSASPMPNKAKIQNGISTWKLDIMRASQVMIVPKGYKTDQAQVMRELRRSWNSGCLDSKSFESACKYGDGPKAAVLLGDSFSFALLDGLKDSLPKDWNLTVLTKGSCLPWDITQFNSSGELNKECNDHNAWVNALISAEKPDLIMATGADQWLQKSTFEQWSKGFSNSLKFFNDNSGKVIIFSSAPGSGNLSTCIKDGISLHACFGTPNQISKFVDFQTNETRKNNSVYVNLVDYLCFKGSCPPIVQDVPVYADGNHLSRNFSSKFSVIIKNLHLFS